MKKFQKYILLVLIIIIPTFASSSEIKVEIHGSGNHDASSIENLITSRLSGSGIRVKAFGKADFVLKGNVENLVKSVILYQTPMEKVISSFSYKLIRDGFIIDSGTRTVENTGGSGVQQTNYEKIADLVSKQVRQKIASFPVIKPPVINPPVITILQPPTGRGIVRVQVQNYLLVKGRVEDEYGISSFQVNKRQVKLDSNGYFSHNARIRRNQQQIKVFAKSKSGKSARVDIDIQKMPSTTTTTTLNDFQKPVLWGLLIGVSDYADNNLDLEFADSDAKALGAFLKKQKGKLYSDVNIKVLVNKSVTRESVLNNITSHLGKASLDDVVFLFLAGHGVRHAQTGTYYFLPHDARHNNLLLKGLGMAALSDSVKILTKNIKRVIVATDTCHAGALQVGARSAESGKDISALFQASQGLFLLSASKSGENSLENRAYALYEDGPGHGAFTSSLILGMKGMADTDEDGSITISELFQYVSKRVPMLTNGLQHPYFRIDGTDMPLILR